MTNFLIILKNRFVLQIMFRKIYNVQKNILNVKC